MDKSRNYQKLKANLINISPRIFVRHRVLFAYIYGSYATGIIHPFSDLDIAVYAELSSPGENLKLELLLALEIDQGLGQGVETDVRVINDLPLVMKGQILTQGELIYCRDDALRVDFETLARNMYFDFLSAIRSYERQYLESALEGVFPRVGNGIHREDHP